MAQGWTLQEVWASLCPVVSVRVFYFALFWSDRVTLYIAQAGLKLTILLPQPTECWDGRWAYATNRVMG